MDPDVGLLASAATDGAAQQGLAADWRLAATDGAAPAGPAAVGGLKATNDAAHAALAAPAAPAAAPQGWLLSETMAQQQATLPDWVVASSGEWLVHEALSNGMHSLWNGASRDLERVKRMQRGVALPYSPAMTRFVAAPYPQSLESW
jgi:hypothetical protein